MRLAIILAEYNRPAPDVSQYRECWPDADIQVYTDLPETPELDPSSPRYGWRMNDYWKVRKCLDALDAGAHVAISFDADMWICDMEAARTLPDLAMRFGICLPMNPRYTVKRDFTDGADVNSLYQPEFHGPSVNCSPIAISNGGRYPFLGVELAREYCRLMLAGLPERGPMVWYRAMLVTGIAPLILPPQFCVCSRHIGVGGEIILHHGHDDVKRHYGYRRVS